MHMSLPLIPAINLLLLPSTQQPLPDTHMQTPTAPVSGWLQEKRKASADSVKEEGFVVLFWGTKQMLLSFVEYDLEKYNC